MNINRFNYWALGYATVSLVSVLGTSNSHAQAVQAQAAAAVDSSVNSIAAQVQKLIKDGQMAQAQTVLSQSLSTRPKDAQLRFLNGVVLAEQGEKDKAIDQFKRLTQDHPYLPEPYNNLAVLYVDQGKEDLAIASLQKAINTNPSYTTAHENLGDIYARLASNAYSKALQLNSNNSVVQPKLALITQLFNVQPPKPGIAVATAQPAPSPVAAKPTPAPAPVVVAAAPAPVATPPAVIAAAPKPVSPPAPAVVAPPPASAVVAPPPPPAVAPAPVVTAAKTPSKPEAAEAQNNAAEEPVRLAVMAWAKAWSDQDFSKYVDSYTKDFQPSPTQSHDAWEKERRARIVGRGNISVEIHNLKINVDGKTASVNFRQNYESGKLRISTRKAQVWSKADGHWRIQKESTGN